MRVSRIPRGIVIGLAASLLTWMLLNWLMPEGRVASAQESTPTPEAEETEEPTATPAATATPLPNVQLRVTVELLPEGDADADGAVDPGDTVAYSLRASNVSDVPVGPLEVAFLYDAAFVGATSGVTEGGRLDAGQVAWTVDQLGPGEARSFQVATILLQRFPPGRTQVQASALVRAGAVELARVGAPSVDVLGPDLRVTDVSVELITDIGQTGQVNPGDTIRFTIAYANEGGGPSAEASLSADYPESLTKLIASNPDNAQDSDGMLTWQLGAVPADGEVRSVQFTVTLADPFPPGTISYDLPVSIRAATQVLSEHTATVAIAGPSLLVTPRVEFVTDADGDGLVDVGDIVQITLQVANVGSEPASSITVAASYDSTQLEVTSVEQEGVNDAQAGTLTWQVDTLDGGASQLLPFQVGVRTLTPGLPSFVINVVTSSDEAGLAPSEVMIAVDAPSPTPTAGPTTQPSVSEVGPAQGQGLLGAYAIAILIGTFLVVSVLAIVYVASRVLPSTAEEREAADTVEERADHRRMVRELIEGIILTAILFSVMILGLQNTLDKDSVNSIIAGIVGYVAGRVASSR